MRLPGKKKGSLRAARKRGGVMWGQPETLIYFAKRAREAPE